MVVFRIIVLLAIVGLSYGGPSTNADTKGIDSDESIDSNEIEDFPELRRDRRLLKGGGGGGGEKLKLAIYTDKISLMLFQSIINSSSIAHCTYIYTAQCLKLKK